MRRIVFLCQHFCFTLMLISCQKDEEPTNKASVIQSNGKNYFWKTVELKYIQDLKKLEGKVITIRAGRHLRLNSLHPLIGDLINYDQSLTATEGVSVSLDYSIHNGVIHGNNFSSIMMLTLYYNYQKSYDYWSEKVLPLCGKSRKDIHHFIVDYDPVIFITAGHENLTIHKKYNAAFDPRTGNFLAFKTSSSEEVPMKTNLFIIAHEFGHKIFHLAFSRNKSSFLTVGNPKLRYIINSINEGFADFSGLMISENPSQISDTSPDIENRDIPVGFTLAKQDRCENGFYCEGSILVSALHEIHSSTGLKIRDLGAIFFKSLEKFRDDWKQIKAFEHERAMLISQNPDTPGGERGAQQRIREIDQNIESFDYWVLLNRIIDELPPRHKVSACEIFEKWFDTEKNIRGISEKCATD